MHQITKFSQIRGISYSPVEFSFVGMSANRANTINIPAGKASTDMCFHLSHAQAVSSISHAIPAGFTNLANSYGVNGSFENRWALSYKELTGSENTIQGIQHGNCSEAVIVVRKTGGSWKTPVFTLLGGILDDSNSLANNGIHNIAESPSILIGFGVNMNPTTNSTYNSFLMTPQTGSIANTTGVSSCSLTGGYLIQNSISNLTVNVDAANPAVNASAFCSHLISIELGAI